MERDLEVGFDLWREGEEGGEEGGEGGGGREGWEGWEEGRVILINRIFLKEVEVF